jgi:hypothetical protein
MAPTPIKFKPMSSSNTSTSSYATHTQSMTVPATPNLINMMRQNDTLARELTQLKRMNQVRFIIYIGQMVIQQLQLLGTTTASPSADQRQ